MLFLEVYTPSLPRTMREFQDCAIIGLTNPCNYCPEFAFSGYGPGASCPYKVVLSHTQSVPHITPSIHNTRGVTHTKLGMDQHPLSKHILIICHGKV
jgi:hypothetical protein